MLEIFVDERQILDWAGRLKDIDEHGPEAIAKGLNLYGEEVVSNISQYVAENTGLDPDEIAALIQVDWATETDLSLIVDASMALAPVQESDWGREWGAREVPTFERDIMLRIVTMNDGFDCPVCQQEAAVPHTVLDIQNMQAKWANFPGSTTGPAPGARSNLVHPNCRCTVQPWLSTSRMPPTAGQSRTPPDLFNMRDMTNFVKAEEVVEWKVDQS